MAQEEDRASDLQFERVEPADGGSPPPIECGRCRLPLVSAYYMVSGQPTCEKCQAQLQLDAQSGSRGGRFAAALLFGLLAAAAGSAVWYAVRAFTGYEVGLIAVVVGFAVGGAVRAGSRGRGGLLYQALAVGLTYFGICAQYVPDIVKAIRESPPPVQQSGAAAPPAGGAAAAPTSPATALTATASPATISSPAANPASPGEPAPTPSLSGFLLAVGLLLALSLAAPFLGGFQNVIGILIIGFALWEAWKMNRRVPLVVEGPYRVGAPPPAAG